MANQAQTPLAPQKPEPSASRVFGVDGDDTGVSINAPVPRNMLDQLEGMPVTPDSRTSGHNCNAPKKGVPLSRLGQEEHPSQKSSAVRSLVFPYK